MGNGQSTSQKLTQIMSNYLEAHTDVKATNTCTQEIQVDFEGAYIKNCPGGVTVTQDCVAHADATMDTVLTALSSANLDSESKQVAEGLALSMQISVTDNEMISKVLNELRANCQSNANNVMTDRSTYNFKNTKIDCEGKGFVLDVMQYADAEASCVVKQIVDAVQQNQLSSVTDQYNKGLSIPDMGACLGVLALLFLAPMLLPKQEGSNGNKNWLKQIEQIESLK